jgi:hypothetical protein
VTVEAVAPGVIAVVALEALTVAATRLCTPMANALGSVFVAPSPGEVGSLTFTATSCVAGPVGETSAVAVMLVGATVNVVKRTGEKLSESVVTTVALPLSVNAVDVSETTYVPLGTPLGVVVSVTKSPITVGAAE